MPNYLLLKSVKSKGVFNASFKNMGIYSSSNINVAKRKLQQWVDMGKKPQGTYLFVSTSYRYTTTKTKRK